MAGLHLDPWQRFILEHSLAEGDDGSWSAFEVGLVVSRQNGKNEVALARELAGLYLLGEEFLVHSAHEFSTSLEHYRRLSALIEGCPELSRRVKKMSASHGDEGVELTSGERIRFRTRTKGGARGFTADCLILDEAMYLPDSAFGALLPILSARPNPQVWYLGSAVDQQVHPDGIVLARVRERGIRGDPAVAYFEWSIPQPIDQVDESIAGDPEFWAVANPALGIRIGAGHIDHERGSLHPRTFAVERLGAGDWPTTDTYADAVIDRNDWGDCLDPDSHIDPDGKRYFAPDIPLDRSAAAIAVAGRRPDNRIHVEVIEHRAGPPSWVADRLEQLATDHDGEVLIDDHGPAAGLISELERRGVRVTKLGTDDVCEATAGFYDSVSDGALRHRGGAILTNAAIHAGKRRVGQRWTWSRSEGIDVSPLVAATLAYSGAATLVAGVTIASIGALVAEIRAKQYAGKHTLSTLPPPPPPPFRSGFLHDRPLDYGITFRSPEPPSSPEA